jgi:hypothetical protein
LEGIERFELADFLMGKLNPKVGIEVGEHAFFAYRTAARLRRMLCDSVEFKSCLWSDIVPTERDRVRQIVLTNVGGRVIPAESTEFVDGFELEQTDEERQAPKWSLSVHGYRTRWSAKKKEWQRGQWEPEGTIDVAFKESFQLLGKDSAYYFVTRSGKVYKAPKPAKGKHRKMVPIWTDPERRVVAFITDGDANRHFFFVRPAKAGDKPAFFELADKPKLTAYDPAAVKRPKAEEPLASVLYYARVPLARKKIKAK